MASLDAGTVLRLSMLRGAGFDLERKAQGKLTAEG